MKKELQDSTKMLADLRTYAGAMRRRVMENIDIAQKGNFTFIGLDELDDITLQIMRNEKALKGKSSARKS